MCATGVESEWPMNPMAVSIPNQHRFFESLILSFCSLILLACSLHMENDFWNGSLMLPRDRSGDHAAAWAHGTHDKLHRWKSLKASEGLWVVVWGEL